MDSLSIKIKGVSPLMMHSDRFANPLDPDSQAHKQLTSKRKKTDDDHMAIQKSEWFGALYYDEKLGPYIPGVMLKACLIGGAKLNRLGMAVKRGVLVLEEKCPLKYKGPRDPEKLYKQGFLDVRSVVISQSRLMRTRPFFEDWELQFTVMYSSEIIDEGDLKLALSNAGNFIGIGDFRPDKGGPYGRFEIV